MTGHENPHSPLKDDATEETAVDKQMSNFLRTRLGNPEKDIPLTRLFEAIQLIGIGAKTFFFGHHQLAIGVDGAKSRGTQNKLISFLERNYKDPYYPWMDSAKKELSEFWEKNLIRDKMSVIKNLAKKMSEDAEMLEILKKVSPALVQADDSQKNADDKFGTGYKQLFSISSYFHETDDQLHFSSHGFGDLPDVTFDAVTRCWELLARENNSHWETLLSDQISKMEKNVLEILKLDNNETSGAKISVGVGSNVHELFARILSGVIHKKKPRDGTSCKKVKVLAGDEDFIGIYRQLLAFKISDEVELTLVGPSMFLETANSHTFDVLVVTPVTSNTQKVISMEKLTSIATRASEIPDCTLIVDATQSIENVPFGFSKITKIHKNCFILGSAIKHCMSGPGLGFVAFPSDSDLVPINTGWLANSSAMKNGEKSGTLDFDFPQFRLSGGTFGFHYTIFSFNAVQQLWKDLKIDFVQRKEYILHLQSVFRSEFQESILVPTENGLFRSSALVLSHPNADEISDSLKKTFGIQVDSREGKYLRIGFGIYHSVEDVKFLSKSIKNLLGSTQVGWENW